MAKLKWSRYIPHKPTEKQLKALLSTKKELLFGGALGGGKFVARGDMLLTPNGFVENEQLDVGDEVCGVDGKSQSIIQWKGWETLDCYRVRFHDGTYLDVPKTHLWSAWRSGRTRKEGGKRLFGKDSAQVVSTETIINWHKTARSVEGDVSQTPWVLIPVPEPIEFNGRWPCSIPAYQLGALLGDGCITDSQLRVSFTCSSADFTHWENSFGKNSVSYDTKHDGNRTIRLVGLRRKLVIAELKSLGLWGADSRSKFIPKKLLTTSIEDRTKLLQGLMDTDGYVDHRGQLYYCSVSKRLRRDVANLVRSLGGVCTEFGKNELYIKLPDSIIPCALDRKVKRLKPRKCTLYKRVVSVRSVGKKEGRCVTVSNPDGLYITNGFIVTHNSDFLLMSCLQYMDVPGYASAIFRKQLTDLKQPGALLDRAKEWLEPWKKHGVKYVPSEHAYKFPTRLPDGTRGADAQLVFCYIGETNAKDRYQSAEYQTICFDEISQWETPADYEFMTTRLRRTTCKTHGKIKTGKNKGKPNWVKGCPECELKRSIPVRLRAATNPGGLGGNWIMRRFQIIPDPNHYPDRRDAIKAATAGIRVPFIGTHPQRDFVPSYIDDNPHLDLDDYEEFLDNLQPELKAQLKDGNWLARADSRFKRDWARYYELFDHGIRLGPTMHSFSFFERIFTTVDLASTAQEGIIDHQVHKKGPSYTVFSTWGVTKDKDLFWLDMRRFRREVPEIVDEGANVYSKWKPRYMQVEFNGVGAGPGQYLQRLGIPVKKLVKTKDKIENSTAAMLLMKAGKVYFPNNAPWLQECEDEVFSWIGLPSETDDIIDTLSDAANDVGPTADAILDENDARTLKSGFTAPPMSLNLSPSLSFQRKRKVLF